MKFAALPPEAPAAQLGTQHEPTVLAMAVCIFLFCTLRTILEAINEGSQPGHRTRLVTRNAVSLVYTCPCPYKVRSPRIPGVKRVAISTGSVLC